MKMAYDLRDKGASFGASIAKAAPLSGADGALGHATGIIKTVAPLARQSLIQAEIRKRWAR